MKRKPAPAVKLNATVGQIAVTLADDLDAAFVAYQAAQVAARAKAETAFLKLMGA